MCHFRNSLLKKILFIITVLTFFQTIVLGQSNGTSFSLYYCFAGLGSELGTMQPTIRINKTNLIYTFEQNSYFGQKSKMVDTISKVVIRQSSIDSILFLLKGIEDTSIYVTNLCMKSGGIHYMTIVNNVDTTNFSLHNTFHRTALKISNIINQYLPKNKAICATEQDIIDAENCLAALRKRWVKEKKKE